MESNNNISGQPESGVNISVNKQNEISKKRFIFYSVLIIPLAYFISATLTFVTLLLINLFTNINNWGALILGQLLNFFYVFLIALIIDIVLYSKAKNLTTLFRITILSLNFLWIIIVVPGNFFYSMYSFNQSNENYIRQQQGEEEITQGYLDQVPTSFLSNCHQITFAVNTDKELIKELDDHSKYAELSHGIECTGNFPEDGNYFISNLNASAKNEIGESRDFSAPNILDFTDFFIDNSIKDRYSNKIITKGSHNLKILFPCSTLSIPGGSVNGFEVTSFEIDYAQEHLNKTVLKLPQPLLSSGEIEGC